MRSAKKLVGLIPAFAAALMLGSFGLVGAGCEEEGPAERAGENIDEGVEKIGENLEEAGENIKRDVD